MSIGVAMKSFRTEFLKFYHMRSFFQKKQMRKFVKKMFNVLRLQATITPQWIHIARNLLSK